MYAADVATTEFQSTLPARGATTVAAEKHLTAAISIHAPRTGSDGNGYVDMARIIISIHAPRTGSDESRATSEAESSISIHAPRTGSDEERTGFVIDNDQFQSTLPARGATSGWATIQRGRSDFNPRSPHGERHDRLHRGRSREPFQSTLPARGATVQSKDSELWNSHFNPRSPHGERLWTNKTLSKFLKISIHAPRTGSDGGAGHAGIQRRISIHAPRTGSDVHGFNAKPGGFYFNPRSPHGERRQHYDRTRYHLLFQSTLPARGATCTRIRSPPDP